MYYDVAWYLCGVLWDVSHAMRAELSVEMRTAYLNQLLQPVLNPGVPDVTKSALLIRLFQAMLAARV